MDIIPQDIVFIVGNTESCFIFQVDKKVVELRSSLYQLNKELEEKHFLKINPHTLFNTMYFENKLPHRQISLKGGSIHKVSRNCWRHF